MQTGCIVYLRKALITHNPDYMSAVAKIQNGRKDEIKGSEKMAVKNVKRSQDVNSNKE